MIAGSVLSCRSLEMKAEESPPTISSPLNSQEFMALYDIATHRNEMQKCMATTQKRDHPVKG